MSDYFPIYDLTGNPKWTTYKGLVCVIESKPPSGNTRGAAGALAREITGPCETEQTTVKGLVGIAYKVHYETTPPWPTSGDYYVFVPSID